MSILPRDVTPERGYATACRPSVCPSVTFRYVFHTGWTSKIISKLNCRVIIMSRD